MDIDSVRLGLIDDDFDSWGRNVWRHNRGRWPPSWLPFLDDARWPGLGRVPAETQRRQGEADAWALQASAVVALLECVPNSPGEYEQGHLAARLAAALDWGPEAGLR